MKRYAIVSSNGIFEYILEVESFEDSTKRYTLKTSNDSNWSTTHREVPLLSVIDTGNGFEFDEDMNKSVDYSSFADLYILLSAIRNIDKHLMESYKLIEFSDGIDI